MADADECRRQASECRRLSQTDVTVEVGSIMRNMSKSWLGLANQMNRLDERNPALAAHLALTR